jgi:hypothetical protein
VATAAVNRRLCGDERRPTVCRLPDRRLSTVCRLRLATADCRLPTDSRL